MRKSWSKRHPYWTAEFIAIAATWIGFANSHYPTTPVSFWTVLGVVGFIAVVGTPFLCYFRLACREMDKAFAHVPTPGEIHSSFVQQFGREPSLEEVAFIQDEYKRGRNEAAINTLILGGGLALGAHVIKGKGL